MSQVLRKNRRVMFETGDAKVLAGLQTKVFEKQWYYRDQIRAGIQWFGSWKQLTFGQAPDDFKPDGKGKFKKWYKDIPGDWWQGQVDRWGRPHGKVVKVTSNHVYFGWVREGEWHGLRKFCSWNQHNIYENMKGGERDGWREVYINYAINDVRRYPECWKNGTRLDNSATYCNWN